MLLRELPRSAEGRAVTACCDGRGQVKHGEGALSFVTLCRDPECVARRERAWAIECGEIEPDAAGDRP